MNDFNKVLGILGEAEDLAPELKKLVEQKKSQEVIKKSTESYQNEVESIGAVSEKIKDKAKDNQGLKSFLDKFTSRQILHQRLLKKLEDQVPPEALEKIRTAREKHLETFGRVMTKLEDRKEKQIEILENLRSGLMEKSTDLGEKIIEIREKVIEGVQTSNQTLRCGPYFYFNEKEFCPTGKVILEKDEQGCYLPPKCIDVSR